MRSQQQSSGDDSTLIQGGRDVTIHNTVINTGITEPEAVDIAERVIRSKLEQFQAEARAEVTRRCAEIRIELVSRISQFDTAMLSKFRDPDIQALLAEAQGAYARSGREDIRRTLVDLVVARCRSDSESLQAHVIREAINTVCKLTRAGIAALTLSFAVNSVTFTFKASASDLFGRFLSAVGESLAPFIKGLPESGNEYTYLIALGVARQETLPHRLGEVFLRKYPGAFQQGTAIEAIETKFRESPELSKYFVPSPSNPNLLIIDAINEGQARQLLPSDASIDLERKFIEQLSQNSLHPDDIEFNLRALGSPWLEILDSWAQYPVKVISPTAIGVAIAYCNFASVLTRYSEIPLSNWIN